LERETVTRKFIEMVGSPHRLDWKKAELTIMVEVMQVRPLPSSIIQKF